MTPTALLVRLALLAAAAATAPVTTVRARVEIAGTWTDLEVRGRPTEAQSTCERLLAVELRALGAPGGTTPKVARGCDAAPLPPTRAAGLFDLVRREPIVTDQVSATRITTTRFADRPACDAARQRSDEADRRGGDARDSAKQWIDEQTELQRTALDAATIRLRRFDDLPAPRDPVARARHDEERRHLQRAEDVARQMLALVEARRKQLPSVATTSNECAPVKR